MCRVFSTHLHFGYFKKNGGIVASGVGTVDILLMKIILVLILRSKILFIYSQLNSIISIIRPHRRTMYIDSAYCYRPSSCYRLSSVVCWTVGLVINGLTRPGSQLSRSATWQWVVRLITWSSARSRIKENVLREGKQTRVKFVSWREAVRLFVQTKCRWVMSETEWIFVRAQMSCTYCCFAFHSVYSELTYCFLLEHFEWWNSFMDYFAIGLQVYMIGL